MQKKTTKQRGIRQNFREFARQWRLQVMIIPAIIFFFIFSYIPIFGLLNAFLNYDLTDGFFGNSWAGLKYFRELFHDKDFYLALRNTFGMSLLKFAFTFTMPILLALVLNELPFMKLKKLTQTGSYLPHFLSYVIVVTLWIVFLDSGGPINDLLLRFHIISKPINFLTNSKWFWWIGVMIDCWQESGWNAIIYLAAISGISPELYEAASVDGAGRLRKMFSITLRSITGTIGALFVLNMGNLLSGGPVGSNFNQSYLLGNSFNHETSYVLQTFVVNTGLNQLRFSFAAAANLILSVLSVVLLFGANKASKKTLGSGIM
ncbi:MAG TPA: sugar ABC transporter permease [Clostridiales bacterium]|nr:sugar ABC transporter permease [Clostridiales bacterium]